MAPRSSQAPKHRGKLGTPIGDHVHWDAVETDDVEEQQFGRLFGQWEFGQEHKMGHLAEPIYHHQDRVAAGWWQTGDKVQ